MNWEKRSNKLRFFIPDVESFFVKKLNQNKGLETFLGISILLDFERLFLCINPESDKKYSCESEKVN